MTSDMKILFVCSGNSKFFPIVPFIKEQGESIRRKGIEVSYFRIVGKYFWGYLKNIPRIKKHLKQNKYDIIHAHYSLCGLIVVLSFPKTPIVVSYMGSDLFGEYNKYGKRTIRSYINIIISKVLQIFIDWIIVKSPNLFDSINKKRITTIIPNGVDFKKFKPIARDAARAELGINKNKKIILFLGDIKNPKKNCSLLSNAYDYLNDEEIELLTPFPLNHSKISLYINASDVLVLSSFNEGSPNVVKEAMACDIPVVATDVGDIKLLLGNTPGYYISSFDPADMAAKIKLALDVQNRPKGRERLASLGLDSDTVADKIINIYSTLLKQRSP